MATASSTTNNNGKWIEEIADNWSSDGSRLDSTSNGVKKTSTTSATAHYAERVDKAGDDRSHNGKRVHGTGDEV
jgi:hypothetical protein